ncbi:hypothetical protein KVV02_004226 [Mortierella alpina]|uniref:Uncharacterized protein n=1 Tax=Mortierella alpina TaxID=64518 RepID=A0A9P8CY67_MORAP|nr:hypothetical protein KVV02_004226 [Mortierella alpina]
MVRLYRFTHKDIQLVSDDSSDNATSKDTQVPAEVSLANLTMFSTILFMAEFQRMGMGDSVDVSKTCNMSEWHRRIYAGATGTPYAEDDYVDVLTLPPKAPSQAGLVYATTHTPDDQQKKEAFSSFLFAHHKPSLAKTIPSSNGQPGCELSPEAQALVATNGVTHIWLCGSDPEQRRYRLMSRCLGQLEKDVLEWKSSEQGSGVITVHTIPQAFPGMVQFLLKNDFKGGDAVVGGESGKVLFWKEL